MGDVRPRLEDCVLSAHVWDSLVNCVVTIPLPEKEINNCLYLFEQADEHLKPTARRSLCTLVNLRSCLSGGELRDPLDHNESRAGEGVHHLVDPEHDSVGTRPARPRGLRVR